MKNKRWRITGAFIVIGAVMIAALSLMMQKESAYIKADEGAEPLVLEGTYTVKESKITSPLPKNADLKLEGKNEIEISGHFTEAVPHGQFIIMHIENMHVRFFVNDALIYAFGEPGTYPDFARSPGNLWDSVVSPGITPEDRVRIEMSNCYTNHENTVYTTFLRSLRAVSKLDSGWLVSNMQDSLFNLFLSMFITSTGIIVLVFTVIQKQMGRTIRESLMFSALALSCGVWFFIDFSIQHFFLPYPVFNNSLDTISLLVCMACLFYYLGFVFRTRQSRGLFILGHGSIGILLLATLCQLTGQLDYYEFIPAIQIVTLLGVAFTVYLLLQEFRSYPGETTVNLIIGAAALCAGALLDLFCNYFEFIAYIVWFKIAFCLFLFFQFLEIERMVRRMIAENARMPLLEKMAYHDAMTSMQNRSAYTERTKELEKAADKHIFGVVVFDINNLKAVNDTLGHNAGDQLIRSTVQLLCQVFDERDIYRIGGDEFVVILENYSEAKYQSLVKKLEACLEDLNQKQNGCIKVDFARGLAVYDPLADSSYSDVFNRADAAMYADKMEKKRGNINTGGENEL